MDETCPIGTASPSLSSLAAVSTHIKVGADLLGLMRHSLAFEMLFRYVLMADVKFLRVVVDLFSSFEYLNMIELGCDSSQVLEITLRGFADHILG